MTKRDYVLIANALVEAISIIRKSYYAANDAIPVVINCLSIALRHNNSRFDNTKFYKYIDQQLTGKE